MSTMCEKVTKAMKLKPSPRRADMRRAPPPYATMFRPARIARAPAVLRPCRRLRKGIGLWPGGSREISFVLELDLPVSCRIEQALRAVRFKSLLLPMTIVTA